MVKDLAFCLYVVLFKGFLGFVKSQKGLMPTQDLFLRGKLLEEYLTYLKVLIMYYQTLCLSLDPLMYSFSLISQEIRKCKPGTISLHVASMIYIAKFLHREHAPLYKDVEVIVQMRKQVNYFQRLATRERISSIEDLKAANKWLDWYMSFNIT